MARSTLPLDERTAFSPREIAAMLGVTPTLIYDEVKRGNIRSTKLGRRTLIPRSELDRLTLAVEADHAAAS